MLPVSLKKVAEEVTLTAILFPQSDKTTSLPNYSFDIPCSYELIDKSSGSEDFANYIHSHLSSKTSYVFVATSQYSETMKQKFSMTRDFDTQTIKVVKPSKQRLLNNIDEPDFKTIFDPNTSVFNKTIADLFPKDYLNPILSKFFQKNLYDKFVTIRGCRKVIWELWLLIQELTARKVFEKCRDSIVEGEMLLCMATNVTNGVTSVDVISKIVALTSANINEETKYKFVAIPRDNKLKIRLIRRLIDNKLWDLELIKISLIKKINDIENNAYISSPKKLDCTCCICLEDVTPGEEIILDCSHIFHASHIRIWAQISQTCPKCRRHISDHEFLDFSHINILNLPVPS